MVNVFMEKSQKSRSWVYAKEDAYLEMQDNFLT